MLALLAAAPALLPRAHLRTRAPRMECVEKFAISKEIKSVSVFDGDFAEEIREAVTQVATQCIAEKGSFSLAIPGGSVVAALGALAPNAFDMQKMHLFLCNEKLPSAPCLAGALEAAGRLGVPAAQVHGYAAASPAEAAAQYAALLESHPAVDNEGALPSFDMMLLGTGADGHCGCVFPQSAEVKATGAGRVALAGNDPRADGDFVALSIDVMCAAKVVLVSAAGAARAPMVAKALSGDFDRFDCPVGLVEAVDQTLWFTDTESIAVFDEQDMEEVDE
ncbi:hypothetical protein AB1Y20_013779 [Prymnesium parvum]|uniref:Glucosamine/galactosamine-6-phosphate isomerase domain-containing protein n=1 Tax=Prymnesium parvum TaxID=97485 RepID=A0AB34IE75_PRYPA|mmetsp:Transcript_5948/g.15122  ORF Transcript_5948/g.15122 Transcript_5948/m.15122 type:complete len:278 (-) Transcript_5948:246-1079(-)